MQSGIKIYSSLPIRSKLELSHGTEIVHTLNGLPSKENTFVPKGPWRKINDKEAKLLLGDQNEEAAYQSIGLFKLPEEIIQLWLDIGIDKAVSENDIIVATNHPLYSAIVAKILNFSKNFARTNEDPIVHNLCRIKAGLRTVTYNSKEKHYLGLHLDSWDRMAPNELANARNRICINLGQDPRYLLFINLEINDLKKYIAPIRSSRPYDFIHSFLTQNPDYPVVRVRVDPFEGYIAPTENLIHEGSSEGQRYQDVQLTLRSYFNIQPVRPKNVLKRILSKLGV